MDLEPYAVQMLPPAILGAIYLVGGVEFAVVMGLALIAAGVYSDA